MELLQVNVNVLSQPEVNGTTGSAVTTPAAQWTMLPYQVMLILPLFLPDPHSAVIVHFETNLTSAIGRQ
jgi:hypothetical protein